jgi:hypothetical protein
MKFFVILRKLVTLNSSFTAIMGDDSCAAKVCVGVTSQRAGILTASCSFVSILGLSHTFKVT